jgi:hypothetical protein
MRHLAQQRVLAEAEDASDGGAPGRRLQRPPESRPQHADGAGCATGNNAADGGDESIAIGRAELLGVTVVDAIGAVISAVGHGGTVAPLHDRRARGRPAPAAHP